MSKQESKDVPVSFEQRVWDTLSRIDVSNHVSYLEATAKRPEVSYLPWHKGWALLKRKFPASRFHYEDDIHHNDGTMEVGVNVTIREESDGTDAVFAYARLPVMNHRFFAIENPNARDINDARQRCLIKALAFAGLGLNLWSDSIIPVGKMEDPVSVEQYGILVDMVEKTETDMEKFIEWCEVEDLKDLPYERYQSALSLLEAKLRRMNRNKAAEKRAKEAS